MRLAADLHDELGANLHTIGLLSDLAFETTNDPEELSNLHRRIRSETERSGTAVRHCTDMLEADKLYTDLKEDMARAARRIMAKLEHEITITGEKYIDQLKPRTRIDLFLFYKECLINICRHSSATQLKTHLSAMETFTPDSSPHFVTFPKGYALGLRAEGVRLWQHNYKFINLGLTMIGTASQKNIFGISHKNAPKVFGFKSDYEKPMYIRTLSNVNDSHVIVRDKWSEMADWKTQKDILSRFPWLPKLKFEEYYNLPHASNDEPLQY